jgi:glycosyltransferase involved in cell wall biosynthesis
MNEELSTSPEQSARSPDAIDLSVLIPVFDEAEVLPHLAARLVEILDSIDKCYEVILVDDGSRDGSAKIIDRICREYSGFRGIYLARNYGQSTALQAGFDHAAGDCVITMDADLQNDPADIPNLLEKLESENLDVVCGWRRDRQDPPIRKLLSRVANRLIRRLTGVRVHDYGCTLKAYQRDVLQNLRLYGEMHRFLPALLAEVGAEVDEVVVRHHAREFGASKYSLDRTFRVILDIVLVVFFLRYVQRPLHLFGGVGIAAFIPGFLILSYLSILKIGFGAEIGDRPMLTLGIMLVLVGVIMVGQGLLGELLTRVLHQSGGKAQYLMKPKRRLGL